MNKLAVERQTFFNLKFDLENQLLEKDDLVSQKDTQISMLKAQIKLMMNELDSAKKNNPSDQGFSGLTPLKMVKKIRGGNHQASTKTMTSQMGEYNETEATEMPSGRVQNMPQKVGGTFITTPNSIFSHRSTTSRLLVIEDNTQQELIEEKPGLPIVIGKDEDEKIIERPARASKGEENTIISQNIEEFKKRHLSKGKKTSQGAPLPNLTDRRTSDSLFGQLKSFWSGSN